MYTVLNHFLNTRVIAVCLSGSCHDWLEYKHVDVSVQ